MKINKILLLALAAAALLVSSCSEDQLTALPSGGTMTDEQLAKAQELNPALVNATLDGMYGRLIESNSGGSTNHDWFSYATFMMYSDLWGQDMIHSSNASWMTDNYNYTARVHDGSSIGYLWTLFYSIIDKSHELIKTITPEVAAANPSLRYALAQARAMRAFAYLHLVQMYGLTDDYASQKSQITVPLVIETTTSTEAANNPPVSMERIFDEVIIPDLEYAVTNLDGFNRGNAKQYINKQVAQGLQARAYMITGNWSGAAAAAAAARAGFLPMTAEAYVDPKTGFNEISNRGWIWGSDVTMSSRITTTGICNYSSFISSFVYGYAAVVGQWKKISKGLYDQIGATDIRKSCFVGADTLVNPIIGKIPPYTNMKVRAYNGEIGGDMNPCDIPMMRVEEMILLEAEAKVRGGDAAGGRTLMVDLIKTYRSSSYAFAGSSAQQVLDEIFLQRRIEFWGEGLSWFDVKRFGKPIERNYAGTNFHPAVRFTIPAGSKKMLIPYPRQEMVNNPGISADINDDGRIGVPSL